MGLPIIDVAFKTLATSGVRRGDRGVVGLVLRDSVVTEGIYTVVSQGDVPSNLSVRNKEQVALATLGNVNSPSKIILIVIPEADINYTKAFKYLRLVNCNYVAFPNMIALQGPLIVAQIKAMREEDKKEIKAVLPNTVANYEGVINFTSLDIQVGAVKYTTDDYCGRIAGLLAGTPMQISATYSVLSEVDDVKRYTKAELDTKVDAGEFVIFHDGEKVKVGRAVNSLTTITEGKTGDYKKIKIIDILDLIKGDIRKTIEDNYIGKFANNYDNKSILINAIKNYLVILERDGLLEEGYSEVAIDMDEQIKFLLSQNVDIADMSDLDIKEANTKDKAFISGKIKPLDAIEDVHITLYN